jgi:predicted ABC-type ATPase
MKNHIKTIIRSLVLEAMRELAPGQKPKMIFLAGGAGSGKSTILRALDVQGKGFVAIDPDEAFEEALRQSNHDLNLNKTETEFFEMKDKFDAAVKAKDSKLIAALRPEFERLAKLNKERGTMFISSLRAATAKAVDLAKEQHDFVVDGTGGNYNHIAELNETFKGLGYNTAMIFVHVKLATSLQRNQERGAKGGRSLRDSVIEKSWENVHKNEQPFRALFDSNFFYIDAENLERSFGEVVGGITRFMHYLKP